MRDVLATTVALIALSAVSIVTALPKGAVDSNDSSLTPAATGAMRDPLETSNDDRAKTNQEHGEYLVHNVAHCVVCHTPHTQSGQLDFSKLLIGAPIPVAGPENNPPWAFESASIAGLGNYEERFVKHLLTQGSRPDGTYPKSPMPKFRLSEQDAEAVIAYLKSVE